MHGTLRVFVLALSMVPCMSGMVSAPVELGVDGSSTHTTLDYSDRSVSQFDLPVQRVRAGFFVSEAVSIEPAMSLSVWQVMYTRTVLELGGDVHYHFPGDPSGILGYAAGGARFSFLDRSSAGSSRDFGVSVGGGVKIPTGSVLGVRFGGGYRRWFDEGANILFVDFGLSFWLGG